MDKFYEFHNGVIVRLDKITGVRPPHQSGNTESYFEFDIFYDTQGINNKISIGKSACWITFIREERQDIYDKISMYNSTGDRLERDIFLRSELEKYKENEYASFINAWKDYNKEK